MYALTGASGHLGRLVIEKLLEKVPANQILATTRDPEKLADLAEKGVVVRQADLDNPAGLPAAFEGATHLLIISTDFISPDTNRTRADQHRAAIAAAVEAGVKHLVYTSAPNPDINSDNIILKTHAQTEQDLQASGLTYTALRNNIYNNELPGMLGLLTDGDTLYGLSGDGKPVWISREDCARIAAAALTNENAPTGPVDATGPEALGFPELAARLSQLQGKVITFQAVSDEEVVAKLQAKGLPAEAAASIGRILLWLTKGDFGPVSDSFEVFTGDKPVSVDTVLTPQQVA